MNHSLKNEFQSTVGENRSSEIISVIMQHLGQRSQQGYVSALVQIGKSRLEDVVKDLQWICYFIREHQYKVELPQYNNENFS